MIYQLSKTSLGMPLGVMLEEAALVSHAQIEVALRDQIYNSSLRIGEILAIRGWIKQETADFFVIYLPDLRKHTIKKPIGEYLKQAALLTDQQVNNILQEQKYSFIRFGAIAVLKGYLKQKTVDFFIESLFPEHTKDPFFMKRSSENNDFTETIHQNQETSIQQITYTEADFEFLSDQDDIHWLG